MTDSNPTQTSSESIDVITVYTSYANDLIDIVTAQLDDLFDESDQRSRTTGGSQIRAEVIVVNDTKLTNADLDAIKILIQDYLARTLL